LGALPPQPSAAYASEDSLNELYDYIMSEYTLSKMQKEKEEVTIKIKEVIAKLRAENIVTAEKVAALKPHDYWSLGILLPIEMKIHILEWLNIKRYGQFESQPTTNHN